jgi:hypothetical protein
MSILLTVLLTMAISYVLISFTEHQVHSRMMHKKSFPNWFYKKWPYIFQIYEGHAIRHHGQWYRDFDFEPNEAGQLDNIFITTIETIWLFLLLSPAILAFFLVSPWAGITFFAFGIAHNRLWNMLHIQMHMPKPVFFAQWPLFHWLSRHHFMHHIYTNRNFNIVFPLADFVLGTVATPKLGHLREMMRLGYLQPRTTRAQLRLARTRSEYTIARSKVLATVK